MFLTNYRESLSNYSQKDILVRIPQCDNSFCCNSQNRPIQRKCGRCHWLFSALETIIYHRDSELRVSITRLCYKNMLICICIFFSFAIYQGSISIYLTPCLAKQRVRKEKERERGALFLPGAWFAKEKGNDKK